MSDLDLYIMTLNKLCLKGISLLSYWCCIWLTSVKRLIRVGISTVFKILGIFLCTGGDLNSF
jgi:hypothetical protein